jgi:hypothetical protein
LASPISEPAITALAITAAPRSACMRGTLMPSSTSEIGPVINTGPGG